MVVIKVKSVINRLGNKTVVGLKVLLILLFMAYYGSTTLFSHTHFVEGKAVAHSHPYLPASHHTHSAASCQLIQLISNQLFTALAIAVALWCGVFTLPIQVLSSEHIAFVYRYHFASLRAPPVC